MSSLAALGDMLTSDEAKVELNRLRNKMTEVAKLHALYSADPAPIDFAYYKAKLGEDLVAPFETSYASLNLPAKADLPIEPPTKETTEAFAGVDALIKASEDRIVELNAMIASMVAAKTGVATTLADVYAQFPEIEDEVDKEIDNHEWYKDTI